MSFGKIKTATEVFCAGPFKPPDLAISLHVVFLEKRILMARCFFYGPKQNSNAGNHSAFRVVAFSLSKMQVE